METHQNWNGYMQRQIIIMTRDTQLRNALSRICLGQGCRVETPVSIAAALEMASRIPVCLTVADISVQDVGRGMNLAEAIHERNPDAKCFLIVDGESSDVLSSAENESWLSVTHKPIRMLHFLSDVVDAIATASVGE